MIVVPAKFESIEKLKTKTNLVFSIKEEIPKLEELQMIQAEGFLAFNVDEYRTQVLGILKNKRIGVDEQQLTHSQRLRNVFFLIWQEQNPGVPFEDFYSEKMEKIIEHYKTKFL
jgi:hypothetical protein